MRGKKTVVLMLQCWSLSSGQKRKWVRSPFGPSVSPPFPPHCPWQDKPVTLLWCCSGRGFNVTNKTRKWENANYFSEARYPEKHAVKLSRLLLWRKMASHFGFLFQPQNLVPLPGTVSSDPGVINPERALSHSAASMAVRQLARSGTGSAWTHPLPSRA